MPSFDSLACCPCPCRPAHAARASSSSNADINLKLRSAQDIRDDVSRESYQGNVEYTRFIDNVLPVIMAVLSSTPPVQWVGTAEIRQRLQLEAAYKQHAHGLEVLQNGLRHLLLETLHRLPQHDPLKAHAQELMSLMLRIMETDNEEHAVIALKIVIELHRNYKDAIGTTTAAFLDLVKKTYGNMQEVVGKTFGDDDGKGTYEDEGSSPNAGAGAGVVNDIGTPGSLISAPTPGPGNTTPRSMASSFQQQQQSQESSIRKIPLGMKSLKLLAECPIAVVFLFQSYRDIVPNELRVFVPLVFGVRSRGNEGLTMDRNAADICLPLDAVPRAASRTSEQSAPRRSGKERDIHRHHATPPR